MDSYNGDVWCCVPVRVRTCMYVCMRVCVIVYVCVRACVSVCACVWSLPPFCTFTCKGLSHAVLKGVLKKGYKVPTPIQRKVLVYYSCLCMYMSMHAHTCSKRGTFLCPPRHILLYLAVPP